MNYEEIVKNYKAQFEGIANPVFYKKLYPTSNSNERSHETWSLYRFGQGLKKKSNDEEPAYFNENKSSYKRIAYDFLNTLKQSNLEKSFGVLCIPSSRKGFLNIVTILLQEILKNDPTLNSFKDLTRCLMRISDKNPAHEGGNRNESYNIETLDFSCGIDWKNLDAMVIFDDIVTSGNSFNAVNKIIREKGFSGDIINFAFARSMNEIAHTNYDEWEGNNTLKNIGSGKIEGIVFDLDQTLVNTSRRCERIESTIKNVHFKRNNEKELYSYNFFENANDIYSVYNPALLEKFQRKFIPFAILSNSNIGRLKNICQIPNIQKCIYPYTYESHENNECGVNEKSKKYYELGTGRHGCTFKYTYEAPKNIFVSPKEQSLFDKSKYIMYSKPHEKGVKEAIEYLKKEHNLVDSSRIIGVGNTLEDIIAYYNAGLETILCLWGIPDILKEYAESNWGADHTFSSFRDFYEWVEMQG
jgi:phosphoglycolate phosphatase-like HAD superfamily hydrolase